MQTPEAAEQRRSRRRRATFLVGHRDARSIEVYTRVFALELAVPFSGDGQDAAAVLRSLPPG